ncbi:MAG: 3-deoxy-D-manno-octulosonate 8-phosphate phosphatase [Deltaproteobacteria bacterium]|nr:MAG: 3-deoxy-D-manno-octulosonate 8-phosphate phosphatase [Deltaproteobacteria bacterium]
MNDKTKLPFAQVNVFLMDVDGVLTGGGIYLGSQEMELKRFHVHDGMGITLLRAAGLRVGILTGRTSEAVTLRSKELDIDMVYQGSHNKLKGYAYLKERYAFSDDQVLYVGDDIQDIPILKRVAIPICVRDADMEAQRYAAYVTKKNAGDGAIREIASWFLKNRGDYEQIIEMMLNKWEEEITS